MVAITNLSVHARSVENNEIPFTTLRAINRSRVSIGRSQRIPPPIFRGTFPKFTRLILSINTNGLHSPNEINPKNLCNFSNSLLGWGLKQIGR
jgi:hypothetical protein